MKIEGYEFVSIDFEHATPSKGSVCAVGIATFKDGIILDKYHSLIRPPKNEYSLYNTRVHKITAEDTKYSKSFGDIFHEIKNRVRGKYVIAHGAFHTDRHCLEQAMTLCGIEEDLNIYWICTQEILNVPLAVACHVCEIKLDHHQSLSDAIACGLLYDAYLRGSIDFDKMKAERQIQASQKKIYRTVYPAKITGEALKPEFDNVLDKENPFYRKKVVISGFDDQQKAKLSKDLKLYGADVDSGIGKNTNYLIIGNNPGPSKIKKMQANIIEGRDAKIVI